MATYTVERSASPRTTELTLVAGDTIIIEHSKVVQGLHIVISHSAGSGVAVGEGSTAYLRLSADERLEFTGGAYIGSSLYVTFDTDGTVIVLS